MKLEELEERTDIQDAKVAQKYDQLKGLVGELGERELPVSVIATVNEHIHALNAVSDSGNGLKKEIRKHQVRIIKILEKECKIVVKNYYRNTWLALGMVVIGIPFGVAFGVTSGNMGLMGIGIPIGMAIGLAMGTNMDKKAAAEGRQLNIELK